MLSFVFVALGGALGAVARYAIRVIKAFYPLLNKAAGTALIMNISYEAGSIEKCYRTNMIDYGMGKAALNMAPAPLSSYEAAGILKDLFAKRREDFTGHRFITNEGQDYPF